MEALAMPLDCIIASSEQALRMTFDNDMACLWFQQSVIWQGHLIGCRNNERLTNHKILTSSLKSYTRLLSDRGETQILKKKLSVWNNHVTPFTSLFHQCEGQHSLKNSMGRRHNQFYFCTLSPASHRDLSVYSISPRLSAEVAHTAHLHDDKYALEEIAIFPASVVADDLLEGFGYIGVHGVLYSL